MAEDTTPAHGAETIAFDALYASVADDDDVPLWSVRRLAVEASRMEGSKVIEG